MRFIFIGPPGVGKGTQALRICDQFGILHLSTGNLLREEITRETEIGIEAKLFIDKGQLAPDDVLLKMMSNRLAKEDCKKDYCLDGFPRTIPQAEGLNSIMSRLKHSLDAIISIDADEEELINRLVLRGQTSGRTDDAPDIIRQRLNIYREQTQPLINYYRSTGLLIDINGVGKIEEITEKILNNLN